MTTFAPLPIPAPGSPAWQEIHPTPPDLRLADVGAVCPLDDAVLAAELHGWRCPVCLAWWDLCGRGGMWVADGPALADLDLGDVVLDVDDEAPVVDGGTAEAEAERRRRRDLRCVWAAGAGAVAGFGFATSRLARPWPHPLPDDAVLFPIAGGLSAMFLAAFAVVEAWQASRGWWRFRHNKVLPARPRIEAGPAFEASAGDEVFDGRR